MSATVEAPRLLALETVVDRTSLSEATIRRMVDAAKFPKPLKISRNRIAWREPDVTAWVNSLAEAA